MTKTFRLPGPDRYDVNARYKPAFLALLPLLVVIAAWLPAVWTALGGLLALACTCGLTLWLANFARARGRAVQARHPELGPALSARLLSHADVTIDPATKARYHGFLRAAGHDLPTADAEAATGTTAYDGCITWLRAATADKALFPMIAEENIVFGFRRNLYGLKPYALVVAATALAANSYGLWRHGPATDTGLWVGAVVEAALLAVGVAWLFGVTPAFVADGSEGYAQRLLAACDELATKALHKTRTKA